MRITMIGAGYVGLVSGACFADFGHDVICVDKDPDKVARLQKGEIPIFEPELDVLVAKNMRAGRLAFTLDSQSAIAQADAVFIAVGTPSRRGDGHADLSYVYEAAQEIAENLSGFTVIVTKSTVPVGTGDAVEAILRKARPDADFAVVSNPEFLREGAAINDFKRPDRIVVGTDHDQARQVMRDIYRPLYLNETPILFTDRRTSELIKYAANAFLAMKITFINEIAELCEKLDANVQEVSKGIGLDNRIGAKFLHAGPGYGGSCFPKDTLALARTANEAKSPLALVDAVIRVNSERKRAMATKIIRAMGGDVGGKTVAILGLAFKPNTDDMRDAPSLDIVAGLSAAGANIRAFDPESMKEAAKILPGIFYADGPYHAVEGSDALVIVTEWDQFRALDLGRVKSLMRSPNIIDLRNIYSPADTRALGFQYRSIGRA